jgi:hypothetical protein
MMNLNAKDNTSISAGYGNFKGGVSWDDNSVVCDTNNNCILRDELATKDNGFSVNGSYGGISGGIKFADNALVAPVDDSVSTRGVGIVGFLGRTWGRDHTQKSFADNATVCDSRGNCMVTD